MALTRKSVKQGRGAAMLQKLPHFYQSGDYDNLLHGFLEIFGRVLDAAEEDLVRVMQAHWVNTANNEGSQGFDALQKGDLDKIFTFYMESLGAATPLKQGDRRDGKEGEEDDKLYRQRILGVIRVLQNGASTKEGIRAIVAANLGILPDLPYSEMAKESIRIVEFLPEPTNKLGAVPVRLYNNIPLNNDGALPAIPEFRLQFSKDLLVPLLDPALSIPSGGRIKYKGPIKPGDDIYFLSDGNGLIEGVPFKPEGSLTLPPGDSTVQLEAKAGIPAGFFDQSFFGYAQFDKPTEYALGVFDQTSFDFSAFMYTEQVATLTAQYLKLSPGAFTVSMPWDIPGFSSNIRLTQQTLDRSAVFGVPAPLLEALRPMLNKSYDTLGDYYKELAPLVKNLTIPVLLSTKALDQLVRLGLSNEVIAKTRALLPIDFSAGKSFPNLQTLLDALLLSEKEQNTVYPGFYAALGLLLPPESPLNIVLRECAFRDRFTRFDISPRTQIGSIVERVKAAGIYAVIAFEKRFWEDQQLKDKYGIQLNKTEGHDITDDGFKIASIHTPDPDGLIQEMSDTFYFLGVFDHTHFGPLSRFG